MKNILIFVGAPGSGKGSLSQLCVKELGWKQLSTGYLCRKHVAEQTEIGKQIDFFIKSGKLITDTLVVAMVEDWLLSINDPKVGVILDGFPRTIVQAEAFDILVKKTMSQVKLDVIKLTVSNERLIERLASRFICKNNDCQAVYSKNIDTGLNAKFPGYCDLCKSELIRRLDDSTDVVRERLSSYRNYERSLLNFFAMRGQDVKYIDVDRPLLQIFEDLKLMIGATSNDNY